ncbi:MAG: hypothetical protein QG570_639 [Patescibacteria group bacterium]|nr:hypothetical protein [Patescibacteria group bacterium]
MDNISESPPDRSPLINRRTAVKGLVAAAGLMTIAATGILSPDESKQQVRSIAENMSNLALIRLKRVKYGINTIPEATRRLDKTLLELRSQEYDLSCEFSATTYLLKAHGFEYTEDQLIEKTTTHEFPWKGVHPGLKNKKLNNSDRFGQLPPNPYGIYPGPLKEMLSKLPDINNSNLNPRSWNQQVIRNNETYKSTIKGLLSYGCPVVGWFSNSENIADIKSVQVGGEVLATNQHAALITACGIDAEGNEMLEYLDPINPSIYYYMTLDELSERAAPVGYNLLSLLPKDNVN